MSDDCEVMLLGQADRDIRKIAKRHPERALMIQDAIDQVEHHGWTLATKSKLIKVLKSGTQIGEIRDMAPPGYRLFFFWVEKDRKRVLYVTTVVAKKSVVAKVRLNTYIRSAEELRNRFLKGD